MGVTTLPPWPGHEEPLRLATSFWVLGFVGELRMHLWGAAEDPRRQPRPFFCATRLGFLRVASILEENHVRLGARFPGAGDVHGGLVHDRTGLLARTTADA